MRSINVLSDYYHGSDWNEGTRNRTRFLSRVPAGDYVLRLEAEYEPGKSPPYYDLLVRSGVPRLYRLVWVLVLLALAPVYYLFKRLGFETARWAESDFSSMTSSDASDDDDE